ncbi:hypothetical protein SDB63_25240, partial [Brucella sp. NBRC 113783]|nr:hypothetical protein [Brucella sp. NBRC 113783]
MHDRTRLIEIGITANPILNGFPILWTGELERDQRTDLREHVFMQDGGALGDHEGPKAPNPATPH